uniref:Uncharacterized protein n=1 Tax=Globisporangium ultimum (strain ATCC 200006 / CBS 805.95 / DAOM BR144) TaxID=431595 RepID=K3WUK7_GLOUD
MAAAKMRGGGLLSQRWQQYDDELEDSDQTIAAIPRAHRRGLVAASQQFSRERKPPPVKSAFFVETTDEEESRGDFRQGGRVDSGADDGSRSRRIGTRSNALPPPRQYLPLAGAVRDALAVSSPQQQHARLHIGAIQFPVTRSVLWDRRVLAEPIGVSVEQVLPRFRVAADALKQVYKLYQDRVATSFAESDLLCYLCGNAATILSGKAEDKQTASALTGLVCIGH